MSPVPPHHRNSKLRKHGAGGLDESPSGTGAAANNRKGTAVKKRRVSEVQGHSSPGGDSKRQATARGRLTYSDGDDGDVYDASTGACSAHGLLAELSLTSAPS
jgi:hypothetical protein